MQDRDNHWKHNSLTVALGPPQVTGEFIVTENKRTCVYMLVSSDRASNHHNHTLVGDHYILYF